MENKEQEGPKVVIHIETAYNVNPAATVVNNTFNIGSREEGSAAIAEAIGGKSEGKKLAAMSLREKIKKGMIDTGQIRKDIQAYVRRIRLKVKESMEEQYDVLWAAIVEHEAFAVELYDPGKQQCTFNRNLVANVIHYLDRKGFYEEPYSAAAMTRALEKDDQHPVRRALGIDPDTKYCDVVDEILKAQNTTL